MDEAPLVTIVTPSYNQGEFIAQTLQSVAQQEYDPVEHIVIDGGSEDDTVEILKSYEEEYNLHWISEPDDGQSDAVNKGIEMASGEIIGWLNADDVYYTAQVIQHVVEVFAEKPEVDVLYGDDVLMDKEGVITRYRSLYEFDYERMRTCGWWGWTPASEATFYRKCIFENERLDTSIDYVMDFEFFLRLGKRYEFGHVDEIFAGKRRHKTAKSVNREAVEREAREIMESYGAEFGLRGQSKLYLALIYIQIRWLLGVAEYANVTEADLAFDGTLPNRRSFIAAQLPSVRNIPKLFKVH